MEKLKLMIVASSIFCKNLLAQAIEKTGLGLVEATASDSSLALEKMKQLTVDVMLYNISMPGSNFVLNVENLKKEHQEIFIILSCAPSLAKNISKADIQALDVLDLIVMPSAADSERNIENIKNQLQGMLTQVIIKKYTSRCLRHNRQNELVMPSSAIAQPTKKKALSSVDLILIASSTGGPNALEVICKQLPSELNKPVLIVQHMQTGLTKQLAQSLDKKCKLPVLEAQDGDMVKPGQILIARGGTHMTIKRSNHTAGSMIKLELLPPVNGVRPSADVLFSSIANVYKGGKILAVILTGMGSDGMRGVEELKKQCECLCLAQSKESCVVYGMPKSVVDAGLADTVEALEHIPYRIMQIVAGKGLLT